MLPGPKPRSPLRADPHRPQPAAPRPGGGEAVPIGRTGGPGGAAVRPHGGDGRADGAVPAGCAAPPARGGPAGERGVGPAGGAGGESRDCGAAGRGAARGAGWGGAERTELSAELFRCSEPLRCRPHLPASTDGARLESHRRGSSLRRHPARHVPSLPAVSLRRRCVGSPGLPAGLG